MNGDLNSMDGEGSAQAVQAESGSGALIPPAREVRPAHEVLVYKPMAGCVLPSTLYEVTGMSRALNLQVTNFNSEKRKIAEISDTESAELVGLKRKRDHALHQIKCFTFNFKQGNFLDFNPEASALKSAKVVSANTNKRKPLDAIMPPSGSLEATPELPHTSTAYSYTHRLGTKEIRLGLGYY